MAAEKEVTLIIRARDRTRTVFRRIRRGAGRLTRGLLRGLAAGAAAFGAAAVAIGKSAEELSNASRLLGVSVEELGAIQIVARRFGLTADEIVDVLDEIRARAGEALIEPIGEAVEAFERLGLAPRDLEGNALRVLERISDAVETTTLNSNELAATLDQLGGDAARRLLPLLRQGGLRGRVQELAGTTRVRRGEQVELAAQATRDAREAGQVIGNEVTNRLVPAIEQAANQFAPSSLLAQGVEFLGDIRNEIRDSLNLD